MRAPLLHLAAAILLLAGPARARDALPAAALALDADGGALSLSGPIGPGTAAALDRLVGLAPGLRLLRLESPGGVVEEARRLAATVRRARLDTYVARACDSACTLVFYAGRGRWLRPGARLGFHAYSPADGGPADPAMIERAEAVERRLYAEGGVPNWFVARIFATPGTELWVPETRELLDSRFATGVAEDDDPTTTPALDGLPAVNRPVAAAGQPALPAVIGPSR